MALHGYVFLLHNFLSHNLALNVLHWHLGFMLEKLCVCFFFVVLVWECGSIWVHKCSCGHLLIYLDDYGLDYENIAVYGLWNLLNDIPDTCRKKFLLSSICWINSWVFLCPMCALYELLKILYRCYAIWPLHSAFAVRKRLRGHICSNYKNFFDNADIHKYIIKVTVSDT